MSTEVDPAEGGLRIVPLASVPTADVVALVQRSLGTGRVPRSAEFWRWKHHDGPFGASVGLAALDAAGQVVGLRTFLPWRWQQGSRTWRAVRAVDTATDPAWRRRGIFRRLTLEFVERLQDDGIAFVFNTPNRVSLAGYLAMGWSVVGRVPLLARPLLPVPRRGRANKFLESAGVVLEEVGEVPGRPQGNAPNGAPSRLRTPLSGELLRWRYAYPPGLDYRATYAAEGAASAMLICHLRRRSRLRELAVAEVLASPGDAGLVLARRTLRRVLATAPAHYAVASASPGTAERRLLLRCGLLPLPHRGPRLAVRRLISDPALPDLTRWDTWRTALGDLELF